MLFVAFFNDSFFLDKSGHVLFKENVRLHLFFWIPASDSGML